MPAKSARNCENRRGPSISSRMMRSAQRSPKTSSACAVPQASSYRRALAIAGFFQLHSCFFELNCEKVKPGVERILTKKTNPTHMAHCRCGAVEIGAWASPIVVTACYCDDCQAAAQRLAESANAAPAMSEGGGTEFMVFRRDRIACIRGAENLQAMRLTAASKTRRMIADCCRTPMYVGFDDKKPWVSAFRAEFRRRCAASGNADLHPVQTVRRQSERRLAQPSGLPAGDDRPHPGGLAAHAVQPAGRRLALVRLR